MRYTNIGALLMVLGSFLAPVSHAQAPENVIQPPSPSVPPNCAAFSGGWSGEWPGSGRIYLWVVSIGPDCSAQVIYGKASKPSLSDKLSQASIKGETLSLPRPNGGTTIFDIKDNAVMGRYKGPGGFNEAMMERVSLGGASQLDAEQRALAQMVPLPNDVPAQCGAFHGQWSGVWSRGNFGEMYLRVVEVKMIGEKCQARLSYSDSNTPIAAKEVVEITGGSIAFICNSSTGGTCVFRLDGSVLNATYTNPAGGLNSATFKRAQ